MPRVRRARTAPDRAFALAGQNRQRGDEQRALGEKNYSTYKNKQNTADKMNFNKYCPRCRKHTLHKEVK